MDLVFQQSESILSRFMNVDLANLTEQQYCKWYTINLQNKLLALNQKHYDDLILQKENITKSGCGTQHIDRLICMCETELNYLKKCAIIEKYNFLTHCTKVDGDVVDMVDMVDGVEVT